MGKDVEYSEDSVFDYNDIIDQNDLEYEDVIMDDYWKPKAGQDHAVVRIQVMCGEDRDEFEQLVSSRVKINDKDLKDVTIKSMSDVRVTLLQKCIINNKGEKVFTKKQLSLINKKRSDAIQYLFTKCMKLNKLTDEEVQEMTEGLENDLNGKSGSNSLNG